LNGFLSADDLDSKPSRCDCKEFNGFAPGDGEIVENEGGMIMRIWIRTVLIGACWFQLVDGSAASADDTYKAGVAVRVITPKDALWMAGYAARNHPVEGKLHELYAKALALEDAKGNKLVLLTSDLLGLPRELSDKVADNIRVRVDLPREALLLTSSHTHCGPVLASSLMDMYDLPAEQKKLIADYTDQLAEWLIETVLAALDDLKPTLLSTGSGKANFVMNRRESTANGVTIGENPKGPVDREVPVLRVQAPDGKVRAIVFGYACHNTTLAFYQWCGDYAGFAQAELEAKHPGAVAMFWSGCGGDANPSPRGKVENAEKHGHELAEAVNAVVEEKLGLLHGTFSASYTRVSLPLDDLGTKEKLAERLAADLQSQQYAVRARAARLSKILEGGGQIDDHYPHYPIQVWRLGGDVLWVALGGEVVVDYDLRLKKELGGGPAVWVTAYANDVMAYIPSARVLKEGGYEADSSMIYYGFPGKWSPAIEEKIVATVHKLVEAK
jgi:hypothetical protein